MNTDGIKKRTKIFAHDVIKLATLLPRSALGDHVGRQLIRCATSVAANYRAALLAQTKASFIGKISIVMEESDETEFWLEFIEDEQSLTTERLLPLCREAHELVSIFIKTRKTAQFKGL
jgi:four helix bundle protein